MPSGQIHGGFITVNIGFRPQPKCAVYVTYKSSFVRYVEMPIERVEKKYPLVKQRS